MQLLFETSYLVLEKDDVLSNEPIRQVMLVGREATGDRSDKNEQRRANIHTSGITMEAPSGNVTRNDSVVVVDASSG